MWINGSKSLKSRCPLKIKNEIKTIHTTAKLNWIELKCFCIFWLERQSDSFLFQLFGVIWFHFKWLLVAYENCDQFLSLSLSLFSLVVGYGERQTNNLHVEKHKNAHMFFWQNHWIHLQNYFGDLLTQMNGLIHSDLLYQNRHSAPTLISSADESEIMMISCMSIFQNPNRFKSLSMKFIIECVFCVGFQFVPYDKMLIPAITYGLS